jgi:hypothetical protein
VALVASAAAGAFVMSRRAGEPSDTSLASGMATGSAAASGSATATGSLTETRVPWHWQSVGEILPANVTRVPGGYIGECIVKGLPAQCVSSDAVTWSLEPDPSIFYMEGAGKFGGWSVATHAGVWVAVGSVDPGTWHSADGVNWTVVKLGLSGLERAHVQALDDGFVMLAETYDGSKSATRVLTSTDGLAWTRRDMPDGLTDPDLVGAIGLVATKNYYDESGNVTSSASFSSPDGVNWRKLVVSGDLASDYSYVTSTVRLPGGGYLGLANYGFGPSGQLVASVDGQTWTANLPLVSVDSLASVGQGVVAIARVPKTDTRALWTTVDGVNWVRIGLLDGHPLSATKITAVGDSVGLLDSSRLVSLGSPATDPQASIAPTATPSLPTPAASTRTLIIGGWRWHELNLDGAPADLQSVVRTARGYIARCGSSMCTSANGWSWQTPPDPSIFSADATALFTPWSYVRGPGGAYVILAGEGLWYSPDGVHWEASQAPSQPYYMGLAAGPDGFAVSGQLMGGPPTACRLYTSPDGAVFTTGSAVECVSVDLVRGDTSGGLLGENRDGTYFYSADGRHWAGASLPDGLLANGSPHRLADGTLVINSLNGPLLASVGGKTWHALDSSQLSGDSDSGMQGAYLAVADGRIFAKDSYSNTAWESSDGGASFHKVLSDVGWVQQFGDLVLVQVGGGFPVFVGAPLSSAEAPDRTPSASGLPTASPTATPSPLGICVGGISESEARRIAVNVMHPPTKQVASASAGCSNGTWTVMYTAWWGGNVGAEGTMVEIDLFTGEVISKGSWIS